MPIYTATVPLHLEYVSSFDTHDFSTFAEAELQTRISIKGLSCKISYQENGDKSITIEKIEAHSEIEAFIIVKSVLPLISNCLSLYIQRKNVNQHYGHIRAKWYRRELNITPRDQYPSATLSDKIITRIDLEGFEDKLLKMWESEELKFITQAYYGSLQSEDLNAKFYHAFTIIEYLENKYKGTSGTKKFLDGHCTEASELIEKFLIGKEYSREDLKNVKGAIKNCLTKMTSESRAEKLLMVLNNYFSINVVNYVTQDVNVDITLIRNFIETRNSLFHGSIIKDTLKRNTDLLILVLEKVIWHLLEDQS